MKMKSFQYSGRNFSGIFNYLKTHDKSSIIMTTDGDISGILTDFLFKPYESNAMIDVNEKLNPPAPHFIIDFSKYKAYIINYQMQTIAGATPPVDWNITGSNDNKTWYLLDEKMNQDEYMCERNPNYVHQCKNRGTTIYTMNNQIGPFRFLKFTCKRNRVNNLDIRIGGFELYGSIIPLNGFMVAKQTKCVDKNGHFSLSVYVVLIYHI